MVFKLKSGHENVYWRTDVRTDGRTPGLSPYSPKLLDKKVNRKPKQQNEKLTDKVESLSKSLGQVEKLASDNQIKNEKLEAQSRRENISRRNKTKHGNSLKTKYGLIYQMNLRLRVVTLNVHIVFQANRNQGLYREIFVFQR